MPTLPGVRRLVTIAALTAAFGYLALCGLLRWRYRDLVYPGMSPSASTVPAWTATPVDTTTRDGLPGRAWLVDAGPGTPVAVIWHGNGDQATDLLGLALDLKHRGVSSLLGEFRGFAGLPGVPDEAGLQADADATLAALAARDRVPGAPPRPVLLVGRSLGTGVAAAIAADPARWQGLDVRGLVLVSPYTSLPDVGALVYPYIPVRLLLPDRFDTLALAPRIAVPTVVLHGQDDTFIPFSLGAAVAHAIPGATLVPVAHAGHNDILAVSGSALADAITGLGR